MHDFLEWICFVLSEEMSFEVFFLLCGPMLTKTKTFVKNQKSKILKKGGVAMGQRNSYTTGGFLGLNIYQEISCTCPQTRMMLPGPRKTVGVSRDFRERGNYWYYTVAIVRKPGTLPGTEKLPRTRMGDCSNLPIYLKLTTKISVISPDAWTRSLGPPERS